MADDTDHTGDDQALRRLLEEAVADVHPPDRLIEIRRRTRRPARPQRRWLPVVVGAGAATAAVVAGAVLVGQLGRSGDDGPPVAEAPQDRAAAVYFVGEVPGGTRLYREFQSVPAASGTEAVTEALARLESDAGPDDPDYRTAWPAGSFGAVSVTDHEVVVSLNQPATRRPAGIAPAAARLGVQQVVYTADAALGRALPVSFEYAGTAARRVLGTSVPGPVDRAAQDRTVAPVNISDPSEGSSVDADFLVARGTMTDGVKKVDVLVQNLDDPGSSSAISVTVPGKAIQDGTLAVRGMLEWEAQIDVQGLGAGRYQLVVRAVRANPMAPVPMDSRTFLVH
ncbi:GerMN domain-containing protein [Nocardioides panacisoli]|uniref:GerMN domain-containing protein n=1 Tax=Nocardioides panacisoli TaxID=627624 RepID=A0ABP7IXN1_9ACTN